MFDLGNLEDTWRIQGGQGHQGLTLSSKGTVSAKKLTRRGPKEPFKPKKLGLCSLCDLCDRMVPGRLGTVRDHQGSTLGSKGAI